MPRDTVVYRPVSVPAGGRVTVHPAFAVGFTALGIDTATGFLDLPGVVVSGHPDRHVLRVVLPGFPNAFYLKRQHTVTRRERFRNWRAGFGWGSRCEREGAVLQQLVAAGLPAPRWAAVGTDDRGRAFLLVEEAAGSCDLRHILSDNALSSDSRRQLAEGLGTLLARMHSAGFTTPDFTAKHLLVSPLGITPIDWQSAERRKSVPVADRLRTLAALHASLPEHLATARERLRVLRAALLPARESGVVFGRFSEIVRRVLVEAARISTRPSIREQRQPAVTASSQRLVWVAGEAVCAIPEVAAVWPTPPIKSPFYGEPPRTLSICLPDRREGVLIRGRSLAPFGRLRAWLRGKSWRSPGVTLGRVLFHLERHDIPAPRLLAFGQRFVGPASAEWFALHTPVAPMLPKELDAATAEELGSLLRRLHDAGCRVQGNTLVNFGCTPRGVCVREIRAVRIAKHLTERDRQAELRGMLGALPRVVWAAAEAGYRGDSRTNSRTNRLTREHSLR